MIDTTFQESHRQETDAPLVTLITPTLNRAEYLEETIESVLAQDYPSIEYIVLDGASTDGTQALLERYTGRLQWLSQPDRNQAEAVNRGFAMAHGEFVGIVNSDDPLVPDSIRPVVDVLQAEPDVVYAFPNISIVDTQGTILMHQTVPALSLVDMLRIYVCPPTSGGLIRRSAIARSGGWGETYRYCPDFAFFLRLALIGPFRRLPQHLGVFRVHRGSITAGERGARMAREQVRVFEEFFLRDDLPEEIQAVRAQAMRCAYMHAAMCMDDFPNAPQDRFHLIDRLNELGYGSMGEAAPITVQPSPDSAQAMILWLHQQVAQRDKTISWLHEEVAKRDATHVWLHEEVATHAGTITELHGEVAVRDETIAWLHEEVAKRDKTISWLHREVAVRDRRIAATDNSVLPAH